MKKVIILLLCFCALEAKSQKMLVLPDTPQFASTNKGVWVFRLANNLPYYSNGSRWVALTSGLSPQTISDSLNAFKSRVVTSYNGKQGIVKGVDSIYFNAGGGTIFWRYNGVTQSQVITGNNYTAGYGLGLNTNEFSADTISANSLVTKYQLNSKTSRDTSLNSASFTLGSRTLTLNKNYGTAIQTNLTGLASNAELNDTAAALRAAIGSGGGSSVDLDSLYVGVNVSKVRRATAILRPVVSSGTITWELLNDGQHKSVFVTSVTTPNNGVVRINFPFTIKKILGYSSSLDESFALHGIHSGPSIGVDYMDIIITYSNFQRFFVSTLTSTTATTPPFCASATVSGNDISYTINGPYANSEGSYGGVLNARYCGSNNRYIRDVLSGLGYGQNKFNLIDPTTGNVVAPTTGDKIILYNPYRIEQLPTQSVGGNLLADKIYTSFSNFWITAEFEVF